jgi:hypothetical protein
MTLRRTSLMIAAACAMGAAVIALPAASAQSPADTVLAGYWEYKVKTLGLTIDTEYWCVRDDQIDKFFTGPCNRHHTCVYPTREVGGGKARFAGYWQNKEGKRASVEVAGDFSAKRFTLRSKPTRGTNGVPIPAMTLDARWLGATCKPGAKTPR